MRSKYSFKKLNFWIFCNLGVLVFLALSQVKCTDTTTTTPFTTTPTTTTTTATTTTTVKKWDTCNIGKGSKREQNLLENLAVIKGKRYIYIFKFKTYRNYL